MTGDSERTCDICDERLATLKFDVFSESGAAIADICTNCEDDFTASGCRVCGTTVRDDADEGLSPHGSPEAIQPLCRDCRSGILFDNGGVAR